MSGAHFHPTQYWINAGNTDKDYDGNNLQYIQSVCKERKVFLPLLSGKKLAQQADMSFILRRLCLARDCAVVAAVSPPTRSTQGGWEAASQLGVSRGAQPTALQHTLRPSS